MENPPALPNPGIAGGLNANAVASGTCAASWRLLLRRMLRASRAAPSRSLHGLGCTNRQALYVQETRLGWLKHIKGPLPLNPSDLAPMHPILLDSASSRSTDT